MKWATSTLTRAAPSIGGRREQRAGRLGIVSGLDNGFVERLGRLLTDTAIAPPTHSLSRAKIRQREAVALHGLDDLGDGRLLFGLGISFGLSKEGSGLLQQILEPAVGQGLLSGGRQRGRMAVISIGAHGELY